MIKKKENILLFFLFSFSAYCAVTIGQSWDHDSQLANGKVTLNYLFSFGEVDKKVLYRENYSTIWGQHHSRKILQRPLHIVFLLLS